MRPGAIRRATPADAPRVAALWTEAYTEDPRGGRTTRYAETEAEEAGHLGDVWVVGEGGEVLGVVVLYPPGVRDGQFAAADEVELSRLAVARAARRRGLARQLTDHCLREAAARGASVVVLWSQPHQVEAHRLYESLGFRREPERDGANGEGPQLVFVRPL